MMRSHLCILFFFPIVVLAQDALQVQQTDNYIYDGNEAFDEANDVEAEKNYRRAVALGAKNDIAQYNLATTLQQDNYTQEALLTYAEMAEITTERPNKHRTFHNIGNALMQLKNYKGAVDAYKNALRNNPNDDETRYNYALAKKMLEEEQQKQDEQQDQDDNQDNKENDDQKQDNDKNQDKDKEQEGDKENEGEDSEDKEKPSDEEEGEKEQKESEQDKDQDQEGDSDNKEQQPQPTQLSPQQVQNLLEAMSNEEKKVQDKLNAKKVKASGTKNKKDW